MKLRTLQAVALLGILAAGLGCFYPVPEPGRERGPEHGHEHGRERDMPR